KLECFIANRLVLLAEWRERVVGIWGVLEQGAEKLQVRRKQVEAFLQHHADAIAQLAMLGKSVQRRLMTALLHLPIERQHNRVLRSEMVVGSSQRDIGLPSDVAHGRLLEAFLAKQLESDLVNAASRCIGLQRCSRGSRFGGCM